MESLFLPALMNRADGFLPGEPPPRRVMVTVLSDMPKSPGRRGEPGKAKRTKPKNTKKKEDR